MVELVRHRQTKEAATDRFYLRPPRHISTLPNPALGRYPGHFRLAIGSGNRPIVARFLSCARDGFAANRTTPDPTSVVESATKKSLRAPRGAIDDCSHKPQCSEAGAAPTDGLFITIVLRPITANSTVNAKNTSPNAMTKPSRCVIMNNCLSAIILASDPEVMCRARCC